MKSLDQHKSIFSVAGERQSYLNMLYLFLSFPLGLGYFCLLVTALSTGMGTLIIWIGVPILWLTIMGWWSLARFERYLAMNWLHIELAPLSLTPARSVSWWRSLPGYLANPMTWKTLLYLLLKFPFGCCCFILVITLPLVGVAMAILGAVVGLLTVPFYALVLALQNVTQPGTRLRAYLKLALSGFFLNILSLHLFNALASLWGQLARTLLSMSDTHLRLEMARVLAEQEHQRAEEAEQRRHELVVNVSHELRAPVASIAGHLESLLLATQQGEQLPDPAALHSYLTIAHQEARRLASLVDELLALARMEASELRLHMEEVLAQEVIEEVYQTLMPLARRERQVTLVRGALPTLPRVLADRQRLLQVLLNLVRNAITSTPAGGIVSINLEPVDAHHLVIIVADNGMGIPPEELSRIFERFYRTDASRSRATGGFGLGLTIVHDLVTAMGGAISVESTPGEGSSFSVRLRSSQPVPLSEMMLTTGNQDLC